MINFETDCDFKMKTEQQNKRQQQINFFKSLNDLERKLYRHIILNKSVSKKAIPVLIKLLKNEALTKAGKHKNKDLYLILSEADKLNNDFSQFVDRLSAELRLLNGSREWLAWIYNHYTARIIPRNLLKWWNYYKTQYLTVVSLRHQFITTNLGLPYAKMNGRQRSFEMSRQDFEDSCQEAVIGLNYAINKFDYLRGFMFSTYAGYWVDHQINRSNAEKQYHIRLPVHIREVYTRINRYANIYRTRFGEEPSNKELCKLFKIDEKILNDAKNSHTVMSLAQPVSHHAANDSKEVGDFIPNKSEIDPVIKMEKDHLNKELRKAINSLSPREKDIIESRWLQRRAQELKHDELTLGEVGDSYKICRERVRQIETVAMNKIKNYLIAKGLGHEILGIYG